MTDNNLTVPTTDLNAPLPVMEHPEVDEVMVKAKKEWYVGIGIFGLFLIGVGGLGWGYAQSVQHAQVVSEVVSQPVSSPMESVAPVARVKPVISVWNGSGVAGAAGKMAEQIKASGYEVVETKNAPKEQTGDTLELTPELLSQKEELMHAAHVSKYTELDGTELEYNARIILGK